MSDLALLARLNEAERRILAAPLDMTHRHVQPHGTVVEYGYTDLKLYLVYEPTDADTYTWVAWLDVSRNFPSGLLI